MQARLWRSICDPIFLWSLWSEVYENQVSVTKRIGTEKHWKNQHDVDCDRTEVRTALKVKLDASGGGVMVR